jgi:hypothetical protein
MKGYYTNEAILVGVESRTSSPVKIPRDKETCSIRRLKVYFRAERVPATRVALFLLQLMALTVLLPL